MTYPDEAAVRRIEGTPRTLVGMATTTAVRKHGTSSWRGVVQGPVELHQAAGLERSMYATARCIASEYGYGPGAALLSIGECLRWEAAERGCDVYQLLTFRSSAGYTWTHGNYGEQKGRHASTAHDPDARTVAAARACASSRLTGGAGRWFAPKTQDGGRQGTGTLENDAIDIAQSWGARGWAWIGPLPGVDSYVHAVLRKVPAPVSNADLVALVKLGRAGRPTVGPSSPDLATAAVAAHGRPWWMIAAAVGAGVVLS